jgi:hypothetical protein
VGCGEGSAALELALVVPVPFVAAPIMPMMTNKAKAAIRADQMGCRRGQARFLDGEVCCDGGLYGPGGWPGGIDMSIPPVLYRLPGEPDLPEPSWVAGGSPVARRPARLEGVPRRRGVDHKIALVF